MIKDLMVSLDGTPPDDVRLAAVEALARRFNARITGLFLHPRPAPMPAEGDSAGAVQSARLIQKAKEVGDRIEAALAKRLAQLNCPAEVRRIDVLAGELGSIAAREARAADTFVALRPISVPAAQDPERLIEGVLFGSGRHLFLVPDDKPPNGAFDRVLVAWNGSRESARAMAEAMPYLYGAKEVTVAVVDDDPPSNQPPLLGVEAVTHLDHHGIGAVLARSRSADGHVGETILAEAERHRADLLVMGGYGHSRLREWLLGGVTYELLYQAPVPLVIAH